MILLDQKQKQDTGLAGHGDMAKTAIKKVAQAEIRAAKSFLKAAEFNPLEVSYYENAANSYMQLGEDDKAIEVLNDVIQKLNPKTGKAEYLLGIIYIGQQKFQKGCEAINQSNNKGFNVPETIIERFCNLSDN